MKRRSFLKKSMLGGMSLPFASAITGLPLTFLMSGSTYASNGDHKFCILSTSEGGQPLNICAPGAYDKTASGKVANPGASGIIHAGDPRTSPGENIIESRVNGQMLNVSDLYNPSVRTWGTSNMSGARAYDSLPEGLQDRLSHFWYNSKSSAHPEIRSVLRAHGALRGPNLNGVEELHSAIAQETAQSLGTIMKEPVSFGFTATSGGKLTPKFSTGSLSSGGNSVENIPSLYKSFVKSFYNEVYKNELTTAQQEFFDNHLLSVSEAERIGAEIGPLLRGQSGFANVSGSGVYSQSYSQLRSALALFYLNITPVVLVNHEYGGDNHSDPGYVRETEEALTTFENLNAFHKLISEHPVLSSLEDKVTYAAVDVFGRTSDRATGRDHRGSSTVGMLYGKHLKGTVLGGASGRGTHNFDPNTGGIEGQSANKIVTPNNSLASLHKTIMSACGIDDARINARLPEGHICHAIHDV